MKNFSKIYQDFTELQGIEAWNFAGKLFLRRIIYLSRVFYFFFNSILRGEKIKNKKLEFYQDLSRTVLD